MINDVTTIILGGGKGTRLFPLTKNRSKPAVPVAGKFRLIDIPISNCINSDIKKIYVLTQFNSESLNRHIILTYQFDTYTKGFVSLLAAEQTNDNYNWFQGTADAVRQCLVHIENFHPKYVLILSGDQLYRMNFKKLFNFHQEKTAEITIATLPVTKEDATGFGILRLNSDKRIIDFKEKPGLSELNGLESIKHDTNKPYLASMGIYLFNFKVLKELLLSTDKIDFGKDIIPNNIGKKNMYGYIFDGYWSDIGTIKSFYIENLKLTDRNPEFSLYDYNSPTYTNRRHLPPSWLCDSNIKSSIICEGVSLNKTNITHSIIGIRTRIDDSTLIEDSILMGADFYPEDIGIEHSPGVGKNCVIKNCIVDKNVNIEDNVQIINKNNHENYDGDNFYIREGIVVIPKNVVIKSGTVI